LTRNETLTVYITCLFSCLVPGHGSENFILPNLIAPFYFATRENRWLEFLQPYLKPWLTPALTPSGGYNASIVEGWYLGLPAGQSIPWGAWLVPLVAWGGFVLASYWMLACLSVMLRGQWAEREALAFPLLRLPLELTEDIEQPEGRFGRFFRNPLMWIGFGIAAFIEGLNGLHLYFPDVPAVPLDLNLNAFFSESPWNQTGWVPCTIFPLAIGVSFLLTTEVSFSLWFFFWFVKFQYIAAYWCGFMPNTMPAAPGVPDKLFTGYQSFGCTLAFVGMVLWTGREHTKHILRRAFGRARATEMERAEVLSYPVAFWGFTAAFALITAFTWLAGVRLDIALALWVSYLVLATALTRVAAEGGMLFLLHAFAPLGAIAGLLGGWSWLTVGNGLVPAALFQSGMVGHMRGFTMPSFLHSFKLARDHEIAPKPLGALIGTVILISLGVSWWMVVRLGYENGGLQLQQSWWAQSGAKMGPQFVDSMQSTSHASPLAAWFWCGVGALLTYGMMAARAYFPVFPFHPLGYVMAMTFPTYMLWPGIMLGWAAKVLIDRFGGVEAVRKTTPLFLGLVMGSVAMMLFWLLIDGWQGHMGHHLMPG
jgi:hypothetical protein